MLISNKLPKTNKLFCFAPISGKFVCASDLKDYLQFFIPGYDAACEEGPGLFAHILTFLWGTVETMAVYCKSLQETLATRRTYKPPCENEEVK